jgi:hypothetical protein
VRFSFTATEQVGGAQQTQHVPFRPTFSRVPRVRYRLMALDHDNTVDVGRFVVLTVFVDKHSVSKEGFSIVVGQKRIARVVLEWIAKA